MVCCVVAYGLNCCSLSSAGVLVVQVSCMLVLAAANLKQFKLNARATDDNDSAADN